MCYMEVYIVEHRLHIKVGNDDDGEAEKNVDSITCNVVSLFVTLFAPHCL